MRLNLLSKIAGWLLVNIFVLALILYFVFNLQFDFAPQSIFRGAASERMEVVAEMIVTETNQKTGAERDAILQKYSESYGVEIAMFSNSGRQISGKSIALPPKIKTVLARRFEPPQGLPVNTKLPPPGRVTIERTTSPTTYWAIARVPVLEKGNTEITKASVIAYSDTITGNGLFFNPMPWILIISTILGLSALIWFPFVRSLNKSISQLTAATKQIADENFEVRVNEKRNDEIGRLGKSVNHLAERLSGFVFGQKRFLGDISHELNSPLARMNWALSNLEERTEEENKKYIVDVREEVELMAKLVEELLTYSKAGIKGQNVVLENVFVRPLLEEVIKRDRLNDKTIQIDVDENVAVRADRELLFRAVSNCLSNAVRYAGEEGEIILKSSKTADAVLLQIIDTGDGVPDDEIGKIFDPLYRVEKDRARKTGGSGLGLAIVKSCIESCGGSVSAANLEPKGFMVEFKLLSR